MDLKMPSPAPQELGVFTLEGEHVSFAAAPGVPVRVAGQPVTAAVAVETDKTVLELGPLQMLVKCRFTPSLALNSVPRVTVSTAMNVPAPGGSKVPWLG